MCNPFKVSVPALLGALLLALGALPQGAGAEPAPAALTASQIVDRCVAARGGIQAWHAVQSMTWKGRMEAGFGDSAARSARYAQSGLLPASRKARFDPASATAAGAEAAKQVQLPFTLDLQRPRKSRLELEFAGKTALQVFDGSNGWKLRPFLNRTTVEPFSPDEVRLAAGQWELEGALIDYASKGSKVELEGSEPVENHPAYRLRLTRSDGSVQHVWIDASSFLDVKVEGAPRRMDGQMHSVWVYQRDFRAVDGVMVPFVLETAVDGYRDTHRMFLDQVAVNPPLDAALFRKPGA